MNWHTRGWLSETQWSWSSQCEICKIITEIYVYMLIECAKLVRCQWYNYLVASFKTGRWRGQILSRKYSKGVLPPVSHYFTPFLASNWSESWWIYYMNMCDFNAAEGMENARLDNLVPVALFRGKFIFQGYFPPGKPGLAPPALRLKSCYQTHVLRTW